MLREIHFFKKHTEALRDQDYVKRNTFLKKYTETMNTQDYGIKDN